MKLKTLILLGLVSALPFATACKKQTPPEGAEINPAEATPTTTESEIAGTASPSDLSPATAQARIDDVTTGGALGADGAIASDKVGNEFAPGKPLYVAMSVGDTPADSSVKVVWYGPGDTRVGEESKTVTAGEKFMNFSAGDTAKWAQGDYRVEVWLADEKVASQDIHIVPASKTDQ
jgi:hypothetical protein